MSALRENQHPAFRCRSCRAVLEAATNPLPGYEDGPPPDSNSFSICVSCGEVSLFLVEDGRIIGLRELTFVELEIFNRDYGDVARAAAQIRARRHPKA